MGALQVCCLDSENGRKSGLTRVTRSNQIPRPHTSHKKEKQEKQKSSSNNNSQNKSVGDENRSKYSINTDNFILNNSQDNNNNNDSSSSGDYPNFELKNNIKIKEKNNNSIDIKMIKGSFELRRNKKSLSNKTSDNNLSKIHQSNKSFYSTNINSNNKEDKKKDKEKSKDKKDKNKKKDKVKNKKKDNKELQNENEKETLNSKNDFIKGELIGEGKYSKVYIGQCSTNGEIVAMKIFKNIDELKKIDIVNNLDKLYELKHPNIISVIPLKDGYDLSFNDENEEFFIIYEYSDGYNLKELIKKYGTLEEKLVQIYCKQLLKGLEYLHKNKIYHKNLRPSNIFIDSNSTVRISDALIDSILLGEEKEMFENLKKKEKNYYIPPFFIQDVKKYNKFEITQAYDLWFIGCLIIEVTSGKKPWSQYNFHKKKTTEFLNFLGETHNIPFIPEKLSTQCQELLKILFDCYQTNQSDIYEKLFNLDFFTKDVKDFNYNIDSFSTNLNKKRNSFSSKGSSSYSHSLSPSSFNNNDIQNQNQNEKNSEEIKKERKYSMNSENTNIFNLTNINNTSEANININININNNINNNDNSLPLGQILAKNNVVNILNSNDNPSFSVSASADPGSISGSILNNINISNSYLSKGGNDFNKSRGNLRRINVDTNNDMSPVEEANMEQSPDPLNNNNEEKKNNFTF